MNNSYAGRTRNRSDWLLALAMFFLFPQAADASVFNPDPYGFPVIEWQNGGWGTTMPDAAAMGDFNGDGKTDMVVAATIVNWFGAETYRLSIFYKPLTDLPVKVKYSSLEEEGHATFGYRVRTGIVAADLNRDGFDDIVVGRRPGVTVLLGNSSGDLIPTRVNATTGADSGDVIATMDVNRDGNLDIVTHNDTAGAAMFGITVYFGDGMGGFPRQRFLATLSEGGLKLQIGDLNGDGFNDIVISWREGPNSGVEIFPHDGVSWFAESRYVPKPAGMVGNYALAVGDFNGDSRDDLMVGGSVESPVLKGIYYYRQSEGQLLPPVELSAANYIDPSGGAVDFAENAIVADFSGDRKDDLIVLRNGGKLGYFEQGSAGLNPEIVYSASRWGTTSEWSGNQSLAAGDMDGNGWMDVAWTSHTAHVLVVFRGQDYLRREWGSSPLIPPPHVSGTVSAPAAASPSLQPVRDAGNSNEGVRPRNMLGELRRFFAVVGAWFRGLLSRDQARSATASLARPATKAPVLAIDADELQCRVTDPRTVRAVKASDRQPLSRASWIER